MGNAWKAELKRQPTVVYSSSKDQPAGKILKHTELLRKQMNKNTYPRSQRDCRNK